MDKDKDRDNYIDKAKTETKKKTTMGLKEAFINASLKLKINLCQAYTLTSP